MINLDDTRIYFDVTYINILLHPNCQFGVSIIFCNFTSSTAGLPVLSIIFSDLTQELIIIVLTGITITGTSVVFESGMV